MHIIAEMYFCHLSGYEIENNHFYLSGYEMENSHLYNGLVTHSCQDRPKTILASCYRMLLRRSR